MRILVCIKQVPGTTKVEVDATTGVLKRSGVPSKMNPYDLYALETALQLKEGLGATVDALSMGPPQAEAVLREAYWMGVDGATLLSDPAFAGADVLATATALAEAIRCLGSYDLVICGKQTSDGDTAQVGPELAELLQIPHLSNVSQILHADCHSLEMRVDYPEAVMAYRAAYPLLITVEKGSISPRLPSYRRKLATKDRAVRRLALGDLQNQNPEHYGLQGSPTQVERIFPPQVNATRQLWQGAGEELAQRLVATLRRQKVID